MLLSLQSDGDCYSIELVVRIAAQFPKLDRVKKLSRILLEFANNLEHIRKLEVLMLLELQIIKTDASLYENYPVEVPRLL